MVHRLVKRLISGALALTLVFSINGFAAVVTDNDGSAFITKAEFDSLKNSFQAQIDSYNQAIDSKIDGAIAAYLAGIQISTNKRLTNLWVKYADQGFTDGTAKFINKPTADFVQPSFTACSYGGFWFANVAALFTKTTDSLGACWSWCTNHATNRSVVVENVPFWKYELIDGEKYVKELALYKTQDGLNKVRTDLTGSNDGMSQCMFECFMDFTYMPDMKCVEGAIRYKYVVSAGSAPKDMIVGPLFIKYIPTYQGNIFDCSNAFFIGSASSDDRKYPIITSDGQLTLSGFDTPQTYQSNPKAKIYSVNNSLPGQYPALRVTSGVDEDMKPYTRMSKWTADDYKDLTAFRSDLLRRTGYANQNCFAGAPIIADVDKGVINLNLKSTNNTSVMFRSDPFPETGGQSSNIAVYTDEAMTTPLSTVNIAAGTVVHVWIRNEDTGFTLWLKPTSATSLSAEGAIILQNEN